MAKRNITTITETLFREKALKNIKDFDKSITPAQIFDYGLTCYLERLRAINKLSPEVIAAEKTIVMRSANGTNKP